LRIQTVLLVVLVDPVPHTARAALRRIGVDDIKGHADACCTGVIGAMRNENVEHTCSHRLYLFERRHGFRPAALDRQLALRHFADKFHEGRFAEIGPLIGGRPTRQHSQIFGMGRTGQRDCQSSG
jgi:hypothetical protein